MYAEYTPKLSLMVTAGSQLFIVYLYGYTENTQYNSVQLGHIAA